MKLLGSDNVEEVQVNRGKAYKRDKGVFNVEGADGQLLKASGDFAVVGTTFRGTQGFQCPQCKRMNVFKDSCGGCGWKET
ncbi:MAG: hypothetical protein WCD70_03500 [Alphaproteobacteria bacterium]